MRRVLFVLVLFVALAADSAAVAAGPGTPAVAALQVALTRHELYTWPIDGLYDAHVRAAVRQFQARSHLAVDGIAGPQTRNALGRFARHRLGSRAMTRREVGWDVAELQFELAWAGFPSGVFDGRFGVHVLGAVRRFQRVHDLPVDGIAGPGTLAALRAPPPEPSLRLTWPVTAAVGDRYGPRGNRFHSGVDLLAPAGTPVTAAAPGRVVWAAERGAWGLLVAVAHGKGIRTFYAHLSTIAVRVSDKVETGTLLGLVGATGDATGPHLHFEVRDNGAAVDPLPLLALPQDAAAAG